MARTRETGHPYEYVTYAPAGQTCGKCRKPIPTDTACRRVDNERSSASSVVVYWHTECATGGAAK
ncbi:hypothetical protein I5Q34_11430 [Streptomyces sp. AV19]|uniref:hypothetical protein n=1 Tax=Streptomyces sp. AV19 TaxID=2793068 RepID=UPI0018FEAB2B|nr:hypothetical protein [Streptomyces sp. AV19]MBH1934878.1 hypothetical protein [Streptomyces sp. AV19]MDG4537012.1 hypothetical protein [Streptomyces sp. AV19]